MERDEVERELHAERQANKKFGALHSSHMSRVAPTLIQLDRRRERAERQVEDEAGLPDDVLSTPPKQTVQLSEDESDAELDYETDSMSSGASNRKRAAPVSADGQINDNYPTAKSDTEEARLAQICTPVRTIGATSA